MRKALDIAATGTFTVVGTTTTATPLILQVEDETISEESFAADCKEAENSATKLNAFLHKPLA